MIVGPGDAADKLVLWFNQNRVDVTDAITACQLALMTLIAAEYPNQDPVLRTELFCTNLMQKTIKNQNLERFHLANEERKEGNNG
ncbi:MAG: hypothetical protein C5B54_09210 [Acidobacteria bacterium]|nr:MAG: hypothetical protein C5B54_09210 [Acidobacteriota bacterium]